MYQGTLFHQTLNTDNQQQDNSLLLNGGIYTYHEDDRIVLGLLNSKIKGSGFGTTVIRHLMKLSLDKRYEGRLMTDTEHSSHLFYLYMGMMQIDREDNYITTQYA